MVEAPLWSALFLGLFLFATGLDELRRPGQWRRMVGEIAASPALQMLTGLVEIGLGIPLYLCNRAAPPDLLATLMMVLGGFMIVEALAITAFTDRLVPFWRWALSSGARGWAFVSLLGGVVLIGIALFRFF